MKTLKMLLIVSTIAIYAITALASLTQGLNWPAVAIADLLALGWRSQFDIDFLIHLFLLATWVTWREGAGPRAYFFGFLSIIMGGMFSFPYILFAAYKSGGESKALLLGVHARP
ncbi:hypothetical protein [Zhongshania sp.]|uniref:hypothetical protein n=1 Tax=Zhongshania sp. TaxID=1971902 RepID=UPI0035673D69